MIQPILDRTVGLMSRLSYRRKFGLVSAVFIIPMLMLLGFTWQTGSADVDFARSERQGIVVITTASEALYGALQGNGQSKPVAGSDAVAAAIVELDAKAEWAQLKAAADQAARADAALALINRVNDSSSLILDPELASYFVGDAIIGKLSNAMTALAAMPNQSGASAESRLQALTQGRTLSAALGDLQSELKKAAGAEPIAVKPLLSKLDQFVAATQPVLASYQTAVEHPLQNGQAIGNLAPLKQAVAAALASGSELSKDGLVVVDTLLQNRISARLSRLAIAIGVSVVALLVAGLLQAGFYLSTEQNIQRLSTSFTRISQGHFDQPARLQGQDELADLNTPIQQMVKTLETFSAAQLAMAAAHDAGNISHLIDASAFTGGWQEMAVRINALILSHTEIEMKMVALTSLYTQGEYSISINEMSGLKSMISNEIERVRTRMQEASVAAEFTLKLKQALDQVQTPVLISDTRDHVIYQNNTAKQRLALNQTDSGPTLNQILAAGSWLDWRAGQASSGQVLHAQRQYLVTVTPIVNEDHSLIGHVSEWLDQTDELEMAKEISGTVMLAAEGAFDQRIDLNGKVGFFADLGLQINTLLDQTRDSLHAFGDALATLAKGDLNHALPDTYKGIFGELAASTNTTIAQLRQSIFDIRDATAEVAKAANELADNSSSLQARTESQAMNTEKTAAAAQEVNGQVKQNAENAAMAAKLVQTTASEAGATQKAMASVQDAMKKLNQSSTKIADITSMIDGIAFQTNILALNAAVEAARAGESGRGFAVVAAEVRNLAQKSAAAAREIRGLVEQSVTDIRQGHERVEDSVKINLDMHKSVQQLATVIEEIASASQEQLTGVNDITQALAEIDLAGQQSQTLSNEQSEFAETMKSEAARLDGAVAVFKIG